MPVIPMIKTKKKREGQQRIEAITECAISTSRRVILDQQTVWHSFSQANGRLKQEIHNTLEPGLSYSHDQ